MKGLYRGFCRNDNGTETIVLNGEKINGEWVQGFLATECHIIDDTDSFTYFGKGGMDGFAKLVIPETVCEAEEKVSVVRCKDCKYCEILAPVKEVGKEAVVGYKCLLIRTYKKAEGFCDYAERREQ
jgi:hypothetical protein